MHQGLENQCSQEDKGSLCRQRKTERWGEYAGTKAKDRDKQRAEQKQDDGV